MSVVRNPFHEALSIKLGGLTVETSMEQISIWGDLELRRDQVSLERARRLRDLLDGVVAALEREGADLPVEALPPSPAPPGANPFS
jgi:hypothetical protein